MASRAEWTTRVQEWGASGESRDAFASKRGLNAKLLQWWASQLVRDARTATKTKTPSVGFARVSTAPSTSSPSTTAAAPPSIEVGLPRGCVIRVGAAFDAKLLGAVVDALEVP